jgi:LL-diaminopimelate aminotransferase
MEAVSKAALNPENYKYGMTESKELLDAVCGWYKKRYNVNLNYENITAVNGSQEGIAHIAFPFCQKGDVVLVPDPGYNIFSFGPSLTGAEIIKMPLLEKNNYLIDFDSIDEETSKKAKMMIVSYPMNPVTAYADYDFYLRLVKFAKKYDIIVVHDNAYSEFIYDSDAGMSFLSVEGAIDVGIEFNSLSKTYNLTGLRLSFALGNADIISKFKAFRSQIDYGISKLIQTAGISALTGPQSDVKKNIAEYKKRRDFLYESFNAIGWKAPKSKSTMFVWLPIPPNYTSSEKFTYDLLEKANVLCVPGVSFGTLGEGYVRMALVQPVEEIEKASKQIKESGIIS